MSVKPAHDWPCWEVIDTRTNQPPEYEWGDGWPHYGDEARARQALADRATDQELIGDHYGVRPAFDQPCVEVHCDEDNCGDEFDVTGEGSTHMDPGCPTEHLEDCEWTVTEDGKHYCPDHAPVEADEEEDGAA